MASRRKPSSVQEAPASRRLSFLDVPAVLDLARFHDLKVPHVKALWRAVVRDGASDLAAAGLAAGVPEACTALLEESCAVTTSTVTETSPSGADKGFKLVVRLASGKQVEELRTLTLTLTLTLSLTLTLTPTLSLSLSLSLTLTLTRHDLGLLPLRALPRR